MLTLFITALIFVVHTAAPAQPDLAGIAAIITAIVGVVGFVATLVKGRHNNKKVEDVEQAGSYIKGFDALIKLLQGEIAELTAERNEAAREFVADKAHLLDTVQALRTQVSEAEARAAVTRGELAELRGQLKGFLEPEQYERFIRHIDEKV